MLATDKMIPKLSFQFLCVPIPHSEGHYRAYIAKYGRLYVLRHLLKVLMRKREVKAILAGFGENIPKTISPK